MRHHHRKALSIDVIVPQSTIILTGVLRGSTHALIDVGMSWSVELAIGRAFAILGVTQLLPNAFS